ncbi:MAG TPA: lysophospholipid acyltransferase family protein [Drouetiella sp.]
MASWTNLKTLGLRDPLKALEKRNPSYFKRYVGEEDEFGYDIKTFAQWEPFFRFCYEDYFKVDCRGIENIPESGRAILVGNHSGLLPIDGAMITMAMCNAHKSPRRIRYLITDWFFTVPGLGEWMSATGQVRATLANAEKLLANDELVGIYPEGLRGVGKTFQERYRMIDFHPGFVQLAIATQTPLIPVATVGGDEIYPHFRNLKSVARLLKMPFYPITPVFPWLPFPQQFFPLPVHWLVNIHKPIDLGYPVEKAKDRKLCLKIARELQYDIQRDLNKLLRDRKSLFTGWEPDEK